MRRGMGRSAVERYLPLAYMSVAFALVALLLPTALRPPQPPPPTSAELSPDAPPDDQILLTELNRGSSGTAGIGFGGAPERDVAAQLPTPQPPPRACRRGIGNPPRQTESIYAPPCAGAFKGDNGGQTWRGVTTNEIRIAVNGTGAGNNPQNDGPYPEQPGSSENAWDRTYRVFETYFNENFQLYNRRLRFFVSNGGAGIEAQRASAVKSDQEHKVFASGFTSEPKCEHFYQHQISAFCAQNPKSYYEKGAPYLYGWYMNGTQLTDFTVEYLCKKLAGKPAVYAGDPVYQRTRRKFGFLLYQTRGYWELGAQLVEEAKRQCDEDVFLLGYDLDSQTGEASLAAAATRFKAEGVTTIIPGMDWISAAAFTRAATNQSWLPEWFTSGGGALDRNQLAQFQDQTQWAHAFGITALDMERPNSMTDCYRAYHSVDPDNDPNYVFCTYVYGSLFFLVTAIQQAGPVLTPTSVQQGLFKLGYRFPARPVWAMGGGFGPGDYTYTDNVAEIWWDPAAPTPNASATGAVGAYKYTRGGQRYRLGEIPLEDPLVFRDGVTVTPDSDYTE